MLLRQVKAGEGTTTSWWYRGYRRTSICKIYLSTLFCLMN